MAIRKKVSSARERAESVRAFGPLPKYPEPARALCPFCGNRIPVEGGALVRHKLMSEPEACEGSGTQAVLTGEAV